jgi:putative ABC transport system permease protein
VLQFILGQLRYRRARVLALGSATLVAVLSFTLLTSAASTSRLQVYGDVARNWQTAYQILVRSPSSVTSLERETGLLRSNYLGGVFGGITINQWKQVLRIPGVEAAAPIANLGYILPSVSIPLPLDDDLTGDGTQIYRLRLTWGADSGLSTYPDSDLYVYVTREHTLVRMGRFGPSEVVPGRTKPLAVCDGYNKRTVGTPPTSPFDHRAHSYITCFSSLSPEVSGYNLGGQLAPGEIGTTWAVSFPILLTAIDPVQESKLLGLDRTIVTGRMLTEAEPATLVAHGAISWPTVPVIASNSTSIDQTLYVSIERLEVTRSGDVQNILASNNAWSYLSQLRGREVDKRTMSAQDLYNQLLEGAASPIDSYWTVDPVSYQYSGPNLVEAVTVTNPPSIWSLPRYGSQFVAPAGNEDVQYRSLHQYPGSNQTTNGSLNLASIDIVGQFDSDRLPSFSPVSSLPLETYFPAQALPADGASREALDGGPLLPTMNLGGYVAQPSLMLTTLEAAQEFLDSNHYAGADSNAPISAIRIEVAGAKGPDRLSQERVRQVAQAIREETGLSADITAGASLHPLTVHLSAGRFGQPALVLVEGWTQKGVSTAIISAIDRKSVLLFALILVVSALFIANAAFASVRSRRREIGVLLCLGWSRRAVFTATLGEVAMTGGVAGFLGAGLSIVIVHESSLKLSLAGSLLSVPAALIVSILASMPPALEASKGRPLDAVRTTAFSIGRPRSVHGVTSFAINELRRSPGSTLLGASSLILGVGALSFLISINLAFHGAVVGTLLGGVVSFEVRAVDYLSVGLALFLAGLSVADILFLNLKERAAEIATLRSMGWGEWQVGRFVALEGLGVGVLGSLIGVLVGLALSSLVGGLAFKDTVAGGLAAGVGVVVALLGSVIPVVLARRISTPRILAEE